MSSFTRRDFLHHPVACWPAPPPCSALRWQARKVPDSRARLRRRHALASSRPIAGSLEVDRRGGRRSDDRRGHVAALAVPSTQYPPPRRTTGHAQGRHAAAGCKITVCQHNKFDVQPEAGSGAAKAARAAQALGVPAIRIDVVNRKVDASDFLQFSIETLMSHGGHRIDRNRVWRGKPRQDHNDPP